MSTTLCKFGPKCKFGPGKCRNAHPVSTTQAPLSTAQAPLSTAQAPVYYVGNTLSMTTPAPVWLNSQAPAPKKACMHGSKCYGLKSRQCPFDHTAALTGGGAKALPVAQEVLAQEAQEAYAQEEDDEAQEAYALAFALEQDDAEYGELDAAFAEMGME